MDSRSKTMIGSTQVRFSELFNDTMEVHGYWFAYDYYVVRGNMHALEFDCWVAGYQATLV